MKIRWRAERKEKEDKIIADYQQKQAEKEEAIKNGTYVEPEAPESEETPVEAPKSKEVDWG